MVSWKNSALTFCCREDNDLYKTLRSSGKLYPRYNSMDTALEKAEPGSGVLVLADEYPRPGVLVDEGMLKLVKEKSIRLFVEYPLAIHGLEIGEPKPTQWERVALATDFFEPDIERNTILALHGCWYLPVNADSAHLVLARVAGYKKVAYEIPEERHPILFELQGYPVLIATSKLSQFISGRYGPKDTWGALWGKILKWLSGDGDMPKLSWMPDVDVAYGEHDKLPEDFEKIAMYKAFNWFRNNAIYSVDPKKGAIEGFESGIDYEGRQMRRTWERSDCISESAMVLALDWAITGNPAKKQLASQMLDYTWSAPDFRQSDPKSPLYGLCNWYERGEVFYGDDNARVILATIIAGEKLGSSRWDEHALRCILANLRTAGSKGFRRNALTTLRDFNNGQSWQYYHNEDLVECAPHYQAYLWACNLWAYALTGEKVFFNNTKTAIRMTMEAYPEKLKWQNGFSGEMARMLLPLAFLVRVEDNEENRGWLNRIAEDLLKEMQPCGAIREKLGPLENGKYPQPRSNEEYGTREAAIIQENGDPSCDLLYAANWAVIGLHEAYAATGNLRFKEAEDKLVEFLCRIQVRSSKHAYLNGCWMRSFDYELWEYWGSSADLGWGPWCVETGWTNSWITAVLAVRQMNESFYSLALSDRFKAIAADLVDEMFRETRNEIKCENKFAGAFPGSDQF